MSDLEAKLDAYRAREFELLDQLDKAGELIRGLQQENAVMLAREQEFVMEQVKQLSFLSDYCVPPLMSSFRF